MGAVTNSFGEATRTTQRHPSRLRLTPWWFCAMACAVPSVFARDASAGSGVLIEAVDDYSLCNGPSLQNSVADATGFANEIKLAGHGGFTGAGQYFNSAVWTSDFMDPERTGQADADRYLFR